MDSLEKKKLALLRILQILWRDSDENHPLMQEDIIRILDTEYGVLVDRRTIGRNIALLKDAGFEIESTRRGSYLVQRVFEDSELRLLIDSVLASAHISPSHSKAIIEKLCSLSCKHFKRHIKNIYSVNDWGKSDSPLLFFNIEIIDEAIERGLMLSFDYNKYSSDKRLHKSASHIVSPYQMLLHNQHYYLMALNEKWGNITFYRMDRIMNIALTTKVLTPLRSVKGYEGGIDYKKIACSRPYMFTDEPRRITFVAKEWAIDQIVDWFGRDITITPEGEDLRVSVLASPNAMLYWCLQYSGAVEVIEPQDLRERVKNALREALEKYEKQPSPNR